MYDASGRPTIQWLHRLAWLVGGEVRGEEIVLPCKKPVRAALKYSHGSWSLLYTEDPEHVAALRAVQGSVLFEKRSATDNESIRTWCRLLDNLEPEVSE